MSNSFAIVFPGQGSQSVGMLDTLLQSDKSCQELFAQAGEILHLDLLSLVQNGPAEELDKTENTQPAMLCAGYAVWQCWQQLGLPEPRCAAGHSLGEYTALCASGIISFNDALPLVAKRGRLMSDHAPGDSCMLAVLGLEEQVVTQCCQQAGAGVSIANFNSSSQLVLAGTRQAVERAGRLCEDAGARRLVPLKVSVPAHSPLLATAADHFRVELDKYSFSEGGFEVIHNIDAASHPAEQIPGLMARHIVSPVQWNKTVEAMLAMGINRIIELGPGKVLSSLCRRPGVKTTSVASLEQLQRLPEFIQQEA